MRKIFCFPLIQVLLILLSPHTVLGWGHHSHPCIGFEASQASGMPPETQTELYPNANNGPDICHFIRNANFAHSNIHFAETMIEVAKSVPIPNFRRQLLTLAYGWGSHIKADEIAHQQMLVGFDELEHVLVELAVDWWLWHQGNSSQQYYAKRASVVWSNWLIWQTSTVFGDEVILPREADTAGGLLSKLILGEAIIMMAPNFYNRATDYSDNTRKLLEGNAWQSYYDDAVTNVQGWFLGVDNSIKAKPINHESQTTDFLSLYQAIGEASIKNGGAQLIETKNEYLTQVQIKIKDQNLCLQVLREVLTEKRKRAETPIQKDLAEALSRILFQDEKPSTNWGFLKRK